MDFSQGDKIAVGTDYVLTIDSSSLQSSDLMNKWVTVCQGLCEIEFTSDHEHTGRGFKANIMFQAKPPGK